MVSKKRKIEAETKPKKNQQRNKNNEHEEKKDYFFRCVQTVKNENCR